MCVYGLNFELLYPPVLTNVCFSPCVFLFTLVWMRFSHCMSVAQVYPSVWLYYPVMQTGWFSLYSLFKVGSSLDIILRYYKGNSFFFIFTFLVSLCCPLHSAERFRFSVIIRRKVVNKAGVYKGTKKIKNYCTNQKVNLCKVCKQVSFKLAFY